MRHTIDEVCVALPIKSHYPQIQEAILVCERVGVRTKYQAHLFNSRVAWPRYDQPGNPTVTMHVVADDARLHVKRCLDVIGAATALVLLSPLMLAVALSIKATSRGPVIFAQERYGLNRRRFRMLKFRTMTDDAEQLQEGARKPQRGRRTGVQDRGTIRASRRWADFFAAPRSTSCRSSSTCCAERCRWSGPRPLPPRDVTRFTAAAAMRRFSVRPGLTCLWQISGRSTLSFGEWIRLDLQYIDGWSLALDLLILARTIPAIVRGTGAQ